MQPGAEFRAWIDRHFPASAKDKRGGRGCAPSQIKRAAVVLDRSVRTLRRYAGGRHAQGKPVRIPDDVQQAMVAYEKQVEQEQER